MGCWAFKWQLLNYWDCTFQEDTQINALFKIGEPQMNKVKKTRKAWEVLICNCFVAKLVYDALVILFIRNSVITSKDFFLNIFDTKKNSPFQTPCHNPPSMLFTRHYRRIQDPHRIRQGVHNLPSAPLPTPYGPGCHLSPLIDLPLLVIRWLHRKENVTLKTFFIALWRIDFFLILWCLWCIMMFRCINKHPWMQKFGNWCSHYQDIYDWISSFNKQSGLPFVLTQQSVGKDE